MYKVGAVKCKPELELAKYSEENGDNFKHECKRKPESGCCAVNEIKDNLGMA